MSARFSSRACLLAIAASVIFITATSTLGAATIVIQNNDSAGVGFNDTTPVAPVGGNSGTTLGQQRLIVFQAAANIWGAMLTSGPTITIRADWPSNLTCTSTSAALGAAGAATIWHDFPGAPFPGTWYSAALANKLAGSDLDPTGAEINAHFNVNLGNPGCLDGTHFYLGLDNIHGNDIDLVTVLLHEFGHGFGFQTFTNASTGVQNSGFASIYDRFLMDDTTGKTWIQMTDAERAASALNTRKLSWNGSQVTGAVPSVLAQGTPLLRVNSPVAIAGIYNVGTASFGPPLSSPGTTGNVIQASPVDGCSALTNAGAISGNIALIDRGTCPFVTKVKNAQNAGAGGVIVVDVTTSPPSSPPPGMGGTDPTITIPSVMITLNDGNAIKAQLGSGVNATLTLDLSVRSGADSAGRALLFTPNPFQGGSSVSHWDSIAFPNQLMEPNISSDLTHSVTPPQDLTFMLLRDVGWVAASATDISFSAANYNVGEGDGKATITVNRSGDLSGTSTVDFATSDGTASQRTDYIVRNGTLTFAPGDMSKTFSVSIIDDAYPESNETVNLTLSNVVGANLSSSTATLTIIDNDASGPSLAQKRFGASFSGASETPPNGSTANGQGYVLLSQSETTASASLQFANLSSAETGAHIHGPAGSGVSAPIVFPLPPTSNPVTDFQINPTAQQVADLKSGLQYMNVHSSNFPNGEIRGQLLWNPTMEDTFFVRQQYLDFLGREPDAGGFTSWVNRFNLNCVSGVQCFHDNSIGVSDAFFFEPEFHQTAGFVFLVYRAAYGNTQPFPNPDGSNPTESNKLPEYGVFTADRARVIGGANLSASQQAFASLLVTRTEFTNKYGPGLNTAALFVDAVLGNIQAADGADLTSQRPALINQFAGGGNAGRAQVLYLLGLDDAVNNPINNRAFVNAEYNRQFALTLYFGYMRRNPDINGFLFWQTQINSAPVADVPKQQALVCSFVTAAEYQQRFGPNAPRNNRECPQ